MKAISSIGRISAYLLTIYLVLRFAQIAAAGEVGLMFRGNWDAANFWIEILMSAVIPVIFLFQKKYRESKTAMFWIAACATAGMSLNRVNVAGLATLSLTDSVYFPAWTEWAVTLGVLSAAGLVYLFAVEHFNLFEGVKKERVVEKYEPGYLDHTDWAALYFGSQRFGELRLYSFTFVLAIALSFGLLSDDAVYGVSPVRTPTTNARVLDVAKTTSPDGRGATFRIDDAVDPDLRTSVLMIDGNRDGRYVLFDHDNHAERFGAPDDPETSCVPCHHMNKPFDKGTRCYECHTDMYLSVDIFDHDFHMRKLGDNEGCAECHRDPAVLKIRENTTDCLECHKGMRPEGSRVNVTDPAKRYLAVGYMDGMHGLCVTCHEESVDTQSGLNDDLARCTNCHRGLPPLEDEVWVSRK
jgi:hypothetical protein